MKKFLGFAASLLFALTFTLLAIPVFGETIATGAGSLLFAISFFTFKPHSALGLNTTNNFTAREAYTTAKKMFWRAFRDKFAPGAGGDSDCANFVESLKLSQSEIRLEVKLDALRNAFTFGVTPNQANTNNIQFNTERRLQLQDSLCVNEYGIFVGNPAADADTEWRLRTYGNTVDFAATTAKSLDSTFYSHGHLQVNANNDVVIPYRGLFNNLYMPQTQQTAALGAASPGDQIRGAEDGFITAEPNLVLIGSKNYVPQLILPAALTIDAADHPRAVIIFRGVLAQNSTVVS